MQRQLNIKAAGWVLGVAFVFGVSLTLVHSQQVVRHADALLFQAGKALEQNRPEQALRYFDHYLKYRPGDTDVMAKYGLAIDKYRQGPADQGRAVLVLNEVLRRDPTRHEARYAVIQCLVSLRRLPEAIVQAEKLLPDWEKKGEMEHIIGWCLEAQGDYKKAASWLRKAIALDPGQAKSCVILAEILQKRLNEPDQAEEVMDSLVKARGHSYQSYLLRRRFWLQRQLPGDADKAQQDLQTARKLAPDEPNVLLAAAEDAQSRRQNDEASQLLERAVQLHPGEESLYQALARLEIAAGKQTQARAVIERGLQKFPQSWDLLVLQTDLLIDEQKIQAAEKNIADLKRSNPTSPLVEYLQARVLMERKQWPEACKLLEHVRIKLAPGSEWLSRTLVYLSLAYQQLGDTEQQLGAIRLAVHLAPNWTTAHFGLGSALLALGRLDEALSELQQVTKSADAPPAVWNVLVRCLILRNLQLPEDQRQWDEVEKTFEQAVQAQPRTAELVILQSEIQLAQKHYPQARRLLDRARVEFPRSMAIECALADMAARHQDYVEAVHVLDQAEKALGDSIELRLARLHLASQRSGAPARKVVAAMGENLQAFSAKDRTRLRRELAETWTKLGDPRQAEQTWRNLIQEQPGDLRARLALLELCLQGGKHDAARPMLAELRKLEGEKGALWRYGAAALIVAESTSAGKLEQARKHLAEASRLRRDWGRVPLLEARIDELEGKLDDAVKHYQSAIKLGERSANIVYRLVQLLQDQRKLADADRELRAFEEQGPLTPDLARLGADLALANGNPTRALDLARQTVPDDSRDYRDYLWMARFYQAAGQSAKAEESLGKAASLGAHNPDTWVALVEHLAHVGRQAVIPEVLAEARRQLPSERLLITLARCHDVMGQPDQAEKFFTEALAMAPNDVVLLASVADFFRRGDQPEKATPLLQQIIDGDAPASILTQARRQLALILAESGQVQRALALIDANIGSGPARAADDRVRKLVDGFDPAKRKKAIKGLEETLKSPLGTADEVFYFAKLCEAGGNPTLAGNLLLGLVNSYPDNPQYLAHYVRFLQENGEVDEARTQFEKLQNREPDSKRTRALKRG